MNEKKHNPWPHIALGKQEIQNFVVWQESVKALKLANQFWKEISEAIELKEITEPKLEIKYKFEKDLGTHYLPEKGMICIETVEVLRTIKYFQNHFPTKRQTTLCILFFMAHEMTHHIQFQTNFVNRLYVYFAGNLDFISDTEFITLARGLKEDMADYFSGLFVEWCFQKGLLTEEEQDYLYPLAKAVGCRSHENKIRDKNSYLKSEKLTARDEYGHGEGIHRAELYLEGIAKYREGLGVAAKHGLFEFWKK